MIRMTKEQKIMFCISSALIIIGTIFLLIDYFQNKHISFLLASSIVVFAMSDSVIVNMAMTQYEKFFTYLNYLNDHITQVQKTLIQIGCSVSVNADMIEHVNQVMATQYYRKLCHIQKDIHGHLNNPKLKVDQVTYSTYKILYQKVKDTGYLI